MDNKNPLQSPHEVRTEPLHDSPAPDANVGLDGKCILDETGEMARPDSGEPCDDGRAGG